VENALFDYSSALRVNPRLAKVYYNRANLRFLEGDFAAAVDDFDNAIRIDRSYVKAYNNSGIARQEQGDVFGAIVF
jgi:tetratricopeptide (TPR) repeat protein